MSEIGGYWDENDFPAEVMEADAREKEAEWLQPMRADGTLPNDRLGPAIGTFVMTRELANLTTSVAQAAEAFAVPAMRVIEAATVSGSMCLVVEHADPVEQGAIEWDGL